MHFVRIFSIMRAYSVRLIAIEEIRNYGKIVRATSKIFLKLAGGRMHTPQASFYPLDASLVMSYRNHQKSLVYFSHLAPLTLFFFTKRPTQKRGGAPFNTRPASNLLV